MTRRRPTATRRKRGAGDPERAEQLAPYLGRRLEVVWGVGSQQRCLVVRGELTSVDAKGLTLMDGLTVVRLPTRWVVRFLELWD